MSYPAAAQTAAAAIATTDCGDCIESLFPFVLIGPTEGLNSDMTQSLFDYEIAVE